VALIVKVINPLQPSIKMPQPLIFSL